LSFDAEVSLPDSYTPFRTKKPMGFDDLEVVTFALATSGVSLGFIGVKFELAYLTLFDLPGGDVWNIEVGGGSASASSDELGLDLFSASKGAAYLSGQTPRDSREVKSKRTEVHDFESRANEVHRHRVLFPTGKSTISEIEKKKLESYVTKAVRNYEEGGP
jgi:hypothetical protein